MQRTTHRDATWDALRDDRHEQEQLPARPHHAFAVPLLEVEALQIDYLANRLRITARGKRYEFSDPKGNADPLFVFHRDVEAARARLKKGDLPAPE